MTLFFENIKAYKDMGEPDSEHCLMNMTQLARVYNEPALRRYDDGLAVLRGAAGIEILAFGTGIRIPPQQGPTVVSPTPLSPPEGP